MNSAEAKQILKDNFECKENSLIYLLHEKNMFSTEQFWKYYDNFPQNYSDYMDRIEYAIWAYFKGDVKWIDEAMFELQR